MESKQLIFQDISYFDDKHLRVNYFDSETKTSTFNFQTIIFPIFELQLWAETNRLSVDVVENSRIEISENDRYNIQRFIYEKLNYQYVSICENAKKQINKLTIDVRRLSKENWKLKSDQANSRVSIS